MLYKAFEHGATCPETCPGKNNAQLCVSPWLDDETCFVPDPQVTRAALLGEMVLDMPDGSSLRRVGDKWVAQWSSKDGWARHTCDTPEAALRAVKEAASGQYTDTD